MGRGDAWCPPDRGDPELRAAVAYLWAKPDLARQLARLRFVPWADADAARERVLWQVAVAWLPTLRAREDFRRFRWWWEQENPGDRAGGA